MPQRWMDRYRAVSNQRASLYTLHQLFGLPMPYPPFQPFSAGTSSPAVFAEGYSIAPGFEKHYRKLHPWVQPLENKAQEYLRTELTRLGRTDLVPLLKPKLFAGDLFGANLGNAYALSVTDPARTSPWRFAAYMVGSRMPGVAAHEMGHLIDNALREAQGKGPIPSVLPRLLPHGRFTILASALAPDPITAAIPGLFHMASWAPLMRSELAASWYGAKLLRSAGIKAAPLAAFAGIPTYAYQMLAPTLFGMTGNLATQWWKKDGNPVGTALASAGLLGMGLRNYILGPRLLEMLLEASNSATPLPRQFDRYLAAYNALGNPFRLLKPSWLQEASIPRSMPGLGSPVGSFGNALRTTGRFLGLPGLLFLAGVGHNLYRRATSK